jgi:hypothetical protein
MPLKGILQATPLVFGLVKSGITPSDGRLLAVPVSVLSSILHRERHWQRRDYVVPTFGRATKIIDPERSDNQSSTEKPSRTFPVNEERDALNIEIGMDQPNQGYEK